MEDSRHNKQACQRMRRKTIHKRLFPQKIAKYDGTLQKFQQGVILVLAAGGTVNIKVSTVRDLGLSISQDS